MKKFTVGKDDPLDFYVKVNEEIEYNIDGESVKLKCIMSRGTCAGCDIHKLLVDFAIKKSITISDAAELCCLDCTHGRKDTTTVWFVKI